MKRPIRKHYELSHPAIYKFVFPFAKENRKSPTAAEAKLWKHIKNRQIDGFKFRRQHVVDRYIPDFICIDVRLIVEVDGSIHEEEEQRKYDLERTSDLEALGFKLIRFTNEQVLEHTRVVLDEIRRALHECATNMQQQTN
ncbi:MAG: endonuclease domain-containing protein [Chitinophagaceae bacterium]|nr:MAG: endonuclease domain-containing protein [Chitinophagaceae bacterium]